MAATLMEVHLGSETKCKLGEKKHNWQYKVIIQCSDDTKCIAYIIIIYR